MARKKPTKKKVFRTSEAEVRIYAAAFFILTFAAIIVVRLLFIQVWEKRKYGQMADKQYVLEIPVEAQRGLIYDRNMEYMVLNEPCVSIGLDKRQMQGTARDYARKLSNVLHISQNRLQARINSVKGNFVWLQRRIDVEIGPKVASLNLPGVLVERDTRRIYPHQEIASHLLGFTDPDNNGLEGGELQFNDLLKGESGHVIIQRDGRGRAVPENVVEQVVPRDGKSIVLTIDYIIQTIATEELRNAARDFNARKGAVIVVNPQSGEILAMANVPSYNPNAPTDYPVSLRRNKVVTDVFEPGSTFKIVSFSAILENHLRNIEDLVFCENGLYRDNGRTIRDVKGYSWLTVADVLKNSSNIGTAKMAAELGGEKFYQAVQAFGFGERTGIELPGETSGLVNPPAAWSEFSLASMSFGQEISVSALQLAMAYAAIANGGQLLKPKILYGVVDENGELDPAPKTEIMRQAISAKTAKTLTNLLVNVVEAGTGQPAKIEGLRIAGKTGTAQKALPNGRGYSENEFVSNFAGFFPAEQPKYLIYVTLDTDNKNQWGKYAAATFKRIAERIRVQEERLLLRVTQAENNQKMNPATKEIYNFVMPNLVDRKFASSKNVLEEMGLQIEKSGSGEFIQSQSIEPGKLVSAGDVVKIELFEVKKSDGQIPMPSLIGLSLREALGQLALHSLEPVVYGRGQVKSQKPSPGSLVRAGTRCVIECDEPNLRSPVLPTSSVGSGYD